LGLNLHTLISEASRIRLRRNSIQSLWRHKSGSGDCSCWNLASDTACLSALIWKIRRNMLPSSSAFSAFA